jgi:hypothetical protein
MGYTSANLGNDIVIFAYVLYIVGSILYIVNASGPWSDVIQGELNASV